MKRGVFSRGGTEDSRHEKIAQPLADGVGGAPELAHDRIQAPLTSRVSAEENQKVNLFDRCNPLPDEYPEVV